MKEKIVDQLGRIVIPKIFRSELGLTKGTPVNFRVDSEAGVLILKKVENECLCCHNKDDLIKLKDGTYLCSDCIRSLIPRE